MYTCAKSDALVICPTQDVLWSVLSDQQLIGRVWRHPQRKRVHIYRLIGGKSPDILLNNLSFSKGLIQETFMNIGNSLRPSLHPVMSSELIPSHSRQGSGDGGLR